MFESLATLAIGMAGTLLYLRLWNWALSRTTDLVQQRRLVQVVFLLGLTPYLLLLFRLMDAAGTIAGPATSPLP